MHQIQIESDGQICSTKVTHADEYSWSGVVERREKSLTGKGNVLFRANVDVLSITALIKQDEMTRQKNKEK